MDNEKLFNVLNEGIRRFGIHTVSFMLSYYDLLSKDLAESIHYKYPVEGTIDEVFEKCTSFLKSYEIQKATYLMQCDTNYLIKDFPKAKKDQIVIDKVFHIVEDQFNMDRDEILDYKSRYGNRVFASGSVIQLFMNILGYNVKDLNALIRKNRWAISRHKNKILKLDFKHPRDISVFKKHLNAKEQLIDFIIQTHGKRD